MTPAEIERLLRTGMCSPKAHAESGCATCTACEAAIAEVRALDSEVRRLRESRRDELMRVAEAVREEVRSGVDCWQGCSGSETGHVGGCERQHVDGIDLAALVDRVTRKAER